MSARPDPLPPDFADAFARARPRLGSLGANVLYFSTVGSTNDVASALAAGDVAGGSAGGRSSGAVVIADTQTAGRGRRGRRWFSPPSSGLYVSVVLTPERAADHDHRAVTLLTLAAGVALAEGMQAATGLRPDIKWPNDLLVGRRKLAGILAEGVASPALHAVVLGYGINVGPMAYPPDLADRATSLESELGRSVDRAALCVETLAALSRRYDDLVAGRFDVILDAWRDRAPGSRGQRVTWDAPSGARTGVTAGIDDRGALLVRVGDRVESIVAGEVVWM